MGQDLCRSEFCPRPQWSKLTAFSLTQAIAGFKGTTSQFAVVKRKGEEKGREGERRSGERERGGGSGKRKREGRKRALGRKGNCVLVVGDRRPLV